MTRVSVTPCFTLLWSVPIVIATVGPLAARAEVMTVPVSRDSAFYDMEPDNNFGGWHHVPVGVTNKPSRRRGVFFANIAAVIPAGATVETARFEFDVTKQGGSQGQSSATYDLHRVTRPWDEGTGLFNIGEATGDGATWSHATPTTAWTTPGGDFMPMPMGSVFINHSVNGAVTYAVSSPALVAAVQLMIDDPRQNNGVLLKSATETESGSALRVTTREQDAPGFGAAARFVISYAPPPPCQADTNGDATVDFADLLGVLSDWGPCPGCSTDLTDDDLVDFDDLLRVLSSWGAC